MSRRALSPLAFLLIVWALSPPAAAVMGTVDTVPAATLLFPWFEVDLDAPDELTTLLWIQNVEAAPTLVNLTLWTDMAVPTFSFDIYLTGYDVQNIDLGSVFAASGDAVRAAHLGQSSLLFGGDCAGRDYGDAVARGYVTVDAIGLDRSPASSFPGRSGYFVSGGKGRASNDNVLMGEFVLLDSVNNFAQGDTAVHIEADSSWNTPGTYTFYGREVDGTAADNREPLVTVWGVPFVNEGTSLVVWRDTGLPGEPYTCGTFGPIWAPMTHDSIIEFDTQTNPEIANPTTSPVFPGAVQRVQVGGPNYPVSIGKAGWIYLNLNENYDLDGAPFGRLRQAWVWGVTADEGLGRFSHGSVGVQLENAAGSRAVGQSAAIKGGGR